jgi:hypothetical protein
MERIHFIINCAFSVLILGLSTTGLFVDHIFTNPKTDIELVCPDGPCQLKISGIKVSSSKIVLDYNKSPDDPRRAGFSKLYSIQGVSFADLADGASRDSSIVEFAHLNIHEEGTEIIGEIGVTEERASIARSMSYVAIGLQGFGLILLLIIRREPKSIISNPDENEDLKSHLLRQSINWFGIIGAGFLWLSVVFYSTIIPTLLAHLFRESRDRSGIEFSQEHGEQFEMKTMGTYVRDHSSPNGSTIILFSLGTAASLIHFVYLFYRSNRKPLTLLQLTPSQSKSLPWYCRVWPWKPTLIVALFSTLLTFLVMNLTKSRGLLINNFYWTYGAKVAQKTGLSRTGTLLDFAQKILSLIAVPRAIMSASTYMWLFVIPVLAFACNRPASLVVKGLQDFAIIFILRSVTAWVTIAPATLSMLEKPECFIKPNEQTSKWSWLLVFDLRQSCNDSMFSETFAVVGMNAIILMYYVMYGGVTNQAVAWLVSSFIALSGLAVCIIAVVSRHQYSSDVVIGASIVTCYMLTQLMAYKMIFEGDSADKRQPAKLLAEKVLPVLEECSTRVRAYLTACEKLKGLKLPANQFAEMALLYRSVGQGITEARKVRRNISTNNNSSDIQEQHRLDPSLRVPN